MGGIGWTTDVAPASSVRSVLSLGSGSIDACGAPAARAERAGSPGKSGRVPVRRWGPSSDGGAAAAGAASTFTDKSVMRVGPFGQ